MDDRTLLELAAKAAGYQIDQRASFMTWRDSRKLALLNDRGGHSLWNAADDDGDALRLAVKLRLEVWNTENDSRAIDDFMLGVPIKEPHGQDPYAATRRAIVRAAAAIGESK